jgi:hypothetical protein
VIAHIRIDVAEVGGLENALEILHKRFDGSIMPDLRKSRLHLTRGEKRRLALQRAINRERARLRKQKEKEEKRKRRYIRRFAARQPACGFYLFVSLKRSEISISVVYTFWLA